MSARRLVLALAAAGVVAAGAASLARADWLQPDPSYRDAQMELRMAARDTVNAAPTAARLDTLAFAHLRLGNLDQAKALFERVLAAEPADEAASAGLGRITLFRGDAVRAESLLARGADRVPGAAADLFAARLRLGNWTGAAPLAEAAGQPGRAALLELLAGPQGCWRIEGPDEVTVSWARSIPVPLVRVQLNGQRLVFALDTGVADLLLDASTARRCGVLMQPEQSTIPWSGTRVAVRNALVQRLELGGLRFERIPAGVTSLRRWSLEANPGAERIAGIIGLNLLARFTPTLDYKKGVLILRRAPTEGGSGRAATFGAQALRVPFEVWGEREITVHGSLNGGRRMALALVTGVPNCGVGAPPEVFEEVGIKAGKAARAVQSASTWLQGARWTAVTVPAVTVGPVAWDKLPGCAGAFDPSELWRHGVRRDGMLSSEFLRGRRVTIDWEKRELVLE